MGLDGLVAEYDGALRRFVGARCGDPARVDDVCQEVWAAVGRALPGFRGDASPRTWILLIARRKLIDAWRADAPITALDDELLDQVPSPRSALVAEERRAALRRALAALPPGDRELIELRYVVGMKPGEIADATGGRANTVAQRLVRALRRLRALLLADEAFASRRGPAP